MAGKDEGSKLAGNIVVYGFVIFMGGLFIWAAWGWIVAGLLLAAFFGIAISYLTKRYVGRIKR